MGLIYGIRDSSEDCGVSGRASACGIPEKIDLEAYMNRNYKFNVSLERFAYLTGRSLSSFKRDFKQIFRESPSRWLTKRRLQEAHFLILKKARKPVDFYLDLGFEDLSHFSFAFKKEFGYSPSELVVEYIKSNKHFYKSSQTISETL